MYADRGTQQMKAKLGSGASLMNRLYPMQRATMCLGLQRRKLRLDSRAFDWDRVAWRR